MDIGGEEYVINITTGSILGSVKELTHTHKYNAQKSWLTDLLATAVKYMKPKAGIFWE